METYNDWLAHYGIKGQRWGKLNGPPYPLMDSQRSSEENRKNPTSVSAKEKYGRKATIKGTGSDVTKKESININNGSSGRKVNIKGIGSDVSKKESINSTDGNNYTPSAASLGNSYYNSILDEEERKRLLANRDSDDDEDDEDAFERLEWASNLKYEEALKRYKENPSVFNYLNKQVKNIFSKGIGNIFENEEDREKVRKVSKLLSKLGF